VQALLPATVSAGRVALVGLHSWTEDDVSNVAAWEIPSFRRDDLRETTRPLLD
jgi:arginase